jgi:phosphate transport system substrate-binding protein
VHQELHPIPEGDHEVKHLSGSRLTAPVVVAATLALGLSACGASNEKSSSTTTKGSGGGRTLSGTLNGAGSSAQQAAMDAWKTGFQTANSAVTINYDPSGSGAGVDQFTAGGVQFAGSDKYLDSTQMKAAQKQCSGAYVEFPAYVSPIAVIYNLPGVSTLNLAPKTLADIFAGKITKWNDPAIAVDNKGAKLPSTAITPVHRSDDSGTTNNFTDYLHQAASTAWTAAASETWPFKSGEGADGTSGVVAAVGKGSGTIGYADASQAGKLGIARIKVGSAFAAPSAAGAAKSVDGSKAAPDRPSNDLAITVNRTSTAPGTYPLLLVSYQIACSKYSTTKTAALVKAFLSYEVSSAGQQTAAKSAGSAPLSSTLSAKAKTAIDSIGSAG